MYDSDEKIATNILTDRLKKLRAQNIIDFEMYIFNRWGEVVRHMTSIDDVWDGTYRGIPVKDDVYVWQIRYVDLNNDPHTLRGHVTCLK